MNMLSRKIILYSVIAIAMLTMICGTVSASAYSITVYGTDTSQILQNYQGSSYNDYVDSLVNQRSAQLGSYLETFKASNPSFSYGTSTGSSGYASGFTNFYSMTGNGDSPASIVRFQESVTVSGIINQFSYSANYN